MPTYIFNIRSQQQIVQRQGKELPDKDAAWREATIRMGKFLRGLNGERKTAQEFEVEVTDELKNRLYLISIGYCEFSQADHYPQDVAKGFDLAESPAT